MIKYLGKEVTPLEMKQIRWKKKADFLSDELEKMESLDKRVSTLEKVRTYNAGWMAGAVAIASVIGGVLAEIFRRCFGV